MLGEQQDYGFLFGIDAECRCRRAVPAKHADRAKRVGFGKLGPREGELDGMICPQMNTKRVSPYLARVAAAHPDEFGVMIVDGSSSHGSKDLAAPEKLRLLRLPACSPELKPPVQVWNEIQENEFPNRVFSELAGVTEQPERGLPKLAADSERRRSLTV